MKSDNTRQNEFVEILLQCRGTLLKVCLHFTRRGHDEMWDLYQDIVAALWESWPGFRGESKPGTWVTGVALKVAATHHRRARRRPDFEALDAAAFDRLADEASDPVFERLYQLIDRLGIDDRALIFLYLDRFTVKEMADITGLSESNIKQRIHRIKLKLITLSQHEKQ